MDDDIVSGVYRFEKRYIVLDDRRVLDFLVKTNEDPDAAFIRMSKLIDKTELDLEALE